MGEELKNKLFNLKKNGWEEATETEKKEIFESLNGVCCL